jgi:PTH1 family peptidyl-tRNA hydrolase
MSEGLFDRLRRVFASSSVDDREETAYGIRLVVGLGNPGSEYAGNRHNVGLWTINRLARRHGIELKSAGRAALGEGRIGARRIALAKPRAYVNESGPVVWNLIKRLKLDDARELLVVHDELDLPVGKVRLRARGGSGGYKGLKSIIDATGSDQFARLRIGIGRPVVDGKPSWEPEHVASYVLSDPPPDQRALLDEAVERAMDAIELAITGNVEAAMQRYN